MAKHKITFEVETDDVYNKLTKKEKLDFLVEKLEDLSVKDFLKVMNEVDSNSDIMITFYQQDKLFYHLLIQREDKEAIEHVQKEYEKVAM